MFRSWRIGRLFNIETSIHWSFWLLILWVLLDASTKSGLASGLAASRFLLAVFGCVYLHELGHAFAAKHYGIRTLDITMLPIGGIARLERLPEIAWQELWISLAGPAVNIVIAFAVGVGLFLRGELAHMRGMDVFRSSFLEQLVVTNLILAIFNMIPALPMDGGRVLRSLLQLRMKRLPATEIAVRVSRYLAFFLIMIGFLKSWWTLGFIGVFVLISGFQELMSVRLQAWRESGGTEGFGGAQGPFAGKGNGNTWFETRFQYGSAQPRGDFDRENSRNRTGDVLDADDIKRID